MKYLLITGALFSALMLQPIQAQEKNNSLNQSQTTEQSVIEIQTKVKGITCKNDVSTLATNVEKLHGVISCTAEKLGPTTTFTIKYNETLVRKERIFETLENTPGCKSPEERPYQIKR